MVAKNSKWRKIVSQYLFCKKLRHNIRHSTFNMRKKSVICGVALVASTGDAFHHGLTNSATHSKHKSSTALNGLFDGFKTGGSGNSKEDLDAQWEAQQRMLKMRKGSTAEKNKYFEEIEERRMEATKKQKDMWSWQTKNYGKGEDPITEWKKKRKEGVISDLEDQYGDPKEVGGIPIPGASFGVGGEFGVGGKFSVFYT
jgi:hypothetical protein